MGNVARAALGQTLQTRLSGRNRRSLPACRLMRHPRDRQAARANSRLHETRIGGGSPGARVPLEKSTPETSARPPIPVEELHQ